MPWGFSAGTRDKLRLAAPAEQTGLWLCLRPFPPPLRVLLPVAIVQMLPDDHVWLHSPIGINLGHVHVIDEIDKLLVAWGAIISASLLF